MTPRDFLLEPAPRAHLENRPACLTNTYLVAYARCRYEVAAEAMTGARVDHEGRNVVRAVGHDFGLRLPPKPRPRRT